MVFSRTPCGGKSRIRYPGRKCKKRPPVIFDKGLGTARGGICKSDEIYLGSELALYFDSKIKYTALRTTVGEDAMLTLFAVHGGFDLTVRASGDTDVDYHHTVEDTGIALGAAFAGALGEKKGVNRYGSVILPML